jgi:GH18 family chitinase
LKLTYFLQATDIDGTPGGTSDEGVNYLKFLATVRKSLPAGKTLSIAAPSSFWYLRNFPIKAMSEVLDYIVTMTYDLHGTLPLFSLLLCDFFRSSGPAESPSV